MSLVNFALVVSGVLLNAVAQLAIKAGTVVLGNLVSPKGQLHSVIRILLQPWIMLGLFSYVVSVGIWIVVLSRVPVSVAYPMLSIGYVINLVFGYFMFGEEITLTKTLGIGIILFGVLLITRSRY
jgi:multidrug transporter EmrE-like cation transporter